MKNKTIIVDEWKKPNRISNRRLNSHILGILDNLSWSVDRITIVGTLREHIPTTTPMGIDFVDFEKLLWINEEEGLLERSGDGWVLYDKHRENIAYIEILKFQSGKGRIDFNPNKIQPFVANNLKKFIHQLFLQPHFSRADIACDIINLDDDFVSQYKLIEPLSFRPIYNRSGKLETAYWGSRSSEKQVRLYNKKIEQQFKKEFIPTGIESWWRLELQLRRQKADEWAITTLQTINNFVSPHHYPDNFKDIEIITLDGLFSNPDNWGRLKKNTKTKYKKLAKEIKVNDILTQALEETFNQDFEKLKKELDSWLLGLEVSNKTHL